MLADMVTMRILKVHTSGFLAAARRHALNNAMTSRCNPESLAISADTAAA